MKLIVKLLSVGAFILIFAITGCSSHKAAMNKKNNIGKKNDKIVTNTTKGKQKVKVMENRSIIKRNIKSNDIKAEKVEDPIKQFISIKSDDELEREAALKKEEEIKKELQKIYFDYDRSDIRSDAKQKLVDNADILKVKSSMDFLIEGHCDERGTEEYNLALGLKRAESVRKYLISLGIKGTNLTTISYGESSPELAGNDENSWQLNRRAILKEMRD